MAYDDDFYDTAARKRYETLEAAKARCLADLAESKATGNEMAAEEELQMLATLNDQQASLSRLHQQYVAQKNPPRQERESVITARRAPADGNDALDILNYGKQPNDPTRLTADEYNRQLAELQRLKSKGMYRD